MATLIEPAPAQAVHSSRVSHLHDTPGEILRTKTATPAEKSMAKGKAEVAISSLYNREKLEKKRPSMPRRISMLRMSSWRSVRTKPVVETTKNELGVFFSRLPAELVLNILDHCSVPDLTRFRAVSKSFRDFVITHESKLARRHMRTNIPEDAFTHYPIPTDTKLTFKFAEKITYHHIVCVELAKHLGEQIVREMMLSANYFIPEQFIAPLQRKLGHGISKILHGIHYFFEEYRSRKLDAINGGKELSEDDQQEIQYQILSKYSNEELLRCHRLFDLMVRLLRRRLCNRAFLFFLHTKLFRYKVKGWESTVERENFYASIFLLGGLPFVWSLYDIKGATNRRRFVSKWYKDCKRGDQKSGFFDNLKDKMAREPPRISKTKGMTSAGEELSPTTAWPPKSPVPTPTNSQLQKLPIDPLNGLFLRASERLLLERKAVRSLEEIKCRAQFVCTLLGNDFTQAVNAQIDLELAAESEAGPHMQPVPFVSVDGSDMAGFYYFDGGDSEEGSDIEDDFSDDDDVDL